MDQSLVRRATSKDAARTPGYLFFEITKITTASDDACAKLEEFLLRRLAKESNARVKHKTLKV